MKPFTNNPRRLSKAQAERLDKTMDEFGDLSGIVHDLDTDEIIGGNQRVNVKKLMALKPTITERFDKPTEDGTVAWGYFDIGGRRFNYRAVKGWSEDQRRRANLVANAGGGSWDLDELANLDPGLLRAVGFDEEKLKEAQGMVSALKAIGETPVVDGLTDPDAVPDVPKKAITKAGDLWVMGKHRLLCGDSTSEQDINRLMDGRKAGLLVTDPPYGVSYADKNRFLNSIARGNRIQEPIRNDHETPADMSILWKSTFSALLPHMKDGAAYYVTGPQGGDLLLLLLLLALRDSDFPLRHMLIWAKNNHVLGRADYNYKHEPIIYGWVNGTHKFHGGGGETSLWEIPKPHKSDLHPTMKPVELYTRAMRNSSGEGDIVLDAFAGSGTCVIAAEQTGRICYAMEIDPLYCDVIVKRWEEFTGKKAVRA